MITGAGSDGGTGASGPNADELLEAKGGVDVDMAGVELGAELPPSKLRLE